MKKWYLFFLIAVTGSFLFIHFGRGVWYPVAVKFLGKKTVVQVIQRYGDSTQQALAPLFQQQGVSYPPDKLALVAFKDTNVLEVWAANAGRDFRLIMSKPIKAASGVLGPKLREGDRQVPEGIYKIIGFNPNSAYHLSMKLNYPNEFDLKQAEADGRDDPGTNIFIHGRAASIGCLAMGDQVIEQLFSLVYATGRDNTTVLIAPTDPSKNELTVPSDSPAWTEALYQEIDSHYQVINADYRPG